MKRWTGLVFGAAAVIVVGVWLAIGVPTRRVPAPTTPRASTQVVAGSLEDLLMELQLVPMEGQAPKAFALDSLDGRRVALADLTGRPALLYFWATW